MLDWFKNLFIEAKPLTDTLPPVAPAVVQDEELLKAVDAMVALKDDKASDIEKGELMMMLLAYVRQPTVLPHDMTGYTVMTKLLELCDADFIEPVLSVNPIMKHNQYGWDFTDSYYQFLLQKENSKFITRTLVADTYNCYFHDLPNTESIQKIGQKKRIFNNITKTCPHGVTPAIFNNILDFYRDTKDETTFQHAYDLTKIAVSARPDLMTEDHITIIKNGLKPYDNVKILFHALDLNHDLYSTENLTYCGKTMRNYLESDQHLAYTWFGDYTHTMLNGLKHYEPNALPDALIEACKPSDLMTENLAKHQQEKNLASFIGGLKEAGVYGQEEYEKQQRIAYLRNFKIG